MHIHSCISRDLQHRVSGGLWVPVDQRLAVPKPQGWKQLWRSKEKTSTILLWSNLMLQIYQQHAVPEAPPNGSVVAGNHLRILYVGHSNPLGIHTGEMFWSIMGLSLLDFL
jgi:hypothetical protein